MSNLRSIFLFALGSVVLATVLSFSLLRTRDFATERRSLRLTSFAADDVDRLEIAPRGGARFALVRGADGRWTFPGGLEAEKSAVLETLDVFADAAALDALSDSEVARLGRGLSDFGLEPAEAEVRLFSDGRVEAFAVGRATPSGGEAYVRAAGTRGVFTVPVAARAAALQDGSHFRRRALFGCAVDDVTGLSLRRGDEAPIKLVRGKGGWRMTAPAEAPADAKVVGELVRRLVQGRIAAFASPETTSATGGLSGDDALAVTVSTASGEPEKVVFGYAAGTNLVHALASDGKTVVLVDAALAKACGVGETTLRDTRVFPVAAESVTRMSFASGETVFELVRTSGVWHLESPVLAPADARTASAALVRVLALKQADVAASGAGRRLSVTLVAGATTWSAASVPESAVLAGGVRLGDFRDKTVFRAAGESLKAVTVKTASGASWDASGAARLRARLAAGVVASRIETLEATPADFARCGFAKPAFSILVDLDDAESPRRSILLGDAAADGGRHAVVGGSDAIFTLSADVVADLTTRDMP